MFSLVAVVLAASFQHSWHSKDYTVDTAFRLKLDWLSFGLSLYGHTGLIKSEVRQIESW